MHLRLKSCSACCICNIGWNYYGVTNRAAVQLRNPHQLGRFLQLTGLSKTCNQGLEDLSGGIQSIRYFQHLLLQKLYHSCIFIPLDFAGTMDIFDVCTGWLFALPKEASVMMPFSVYIASRVFHESCCSIIPFLWRYRHLGDSTGSNQLLYIHSLMSNFPTTVASLSRLRSHDTHSLQPIAQNIPLGHYFCYEWKLTYFYWAETSTSKKKIFIELENRIRFLNCNERS